MRRFIWEDSDWPELTWDATRALPAIDIARREQFRFLGQSDGLTREQRLEIVVRAAAESATENAAIEGEILNPASVYSSVVRRLGLETGPAQDDRTEGVVAMTLDASRNFGKPLTSERLFTWHADLFPLKLGASTGLTIANWRQPSSDPMQVLSGPVGRTRMHFEAPPGADVPLMMLEFLDWFNASEGKANGLARAALAHLWFLTIHPFDDGNGRIARAIADLALAQDEGSSDRFYSVSAQIHAERRDYYDAIERAQRGPLDVSDWVLWFLGCFTRAIDTSRGAVARARRAVLFWQHHARENLNERQRKVLERLLGDFEGDLNQRKYIAIAKTSPATAQRDLADLVERGIVRAEGAARATRYVLT
jgi:Fic family protein